MSAETRQHPRARAKIPVEFHCGATTGLGSTNDVSEGGMFLETDALAPVGTRIYLRLRLPGEDAATNALIGVVKRVETEEREGAPRGMGIRFEVAYARARETLGGFVGEALTDPEGAQLRLSALPEPPRDETPSSVPEEPSTAGGASTWIWALGIAMVAAAVWRLLV